MKFYAASAAINADPASIWAILTDAPGYAEWNSGVVRVEGRIGPSEGIRVFSEVNPKRAFAADVVEFRPNERMVWVGGMPLGLFKGTRTFTLAPDQGGATQFTMREEYTGPLLPLIWRTMPNLQPSFDQFARGLKARAERSG